MNKIISIVVCCMFLASVLSAVGSNVDTNSNNRINETTSFEDDCGCCDYNTIDIQYSDLFPACPVMTEPQSPLDPDKASPKPMLIEAPDEFSWCDYNGEDWTTPAKNQGDCGSCWDFAAVGLFEHMINIGEGYANLDPDLSEQYVLSCLPWAGSCGGGNTLQALELIMDTGYAGNYYNGLITETCMPYEADDTVPCSDKCPNWVDLLVPLADYGYWYTSGSSTDLELMKSQIISSGPIAVSMLATDEFMQWGLTHHGEDEYYPYPGYVGWDTNHVVNIVGWKDNVSIPNGGYWVVKNSWGQYWGNQGFFNIEYNSLNIDDNHVIWAEYNPNSFDWKPVANAGGSYYGDVDELISFDGSDSFDCEGTIVTYEWDFGDGYTGSGVSPTHAYDERGIYIVTLNVTDESGQHHVDETVALVDIWMTDDSWTYQFDDISINVDDLTGQSMALNAKLDDFTISVADDSSDEFQVDFKGSLSGSFSASISSQQMNLHVNGTLLKLTKLSGSAYIRQSDLALSQASGRVIGLAILFINKIPIPIPLPFRATFSADFNVPFDFLDLPLSGGKSGQLPMIDINMEVSVGGIFGLIKQTFTQPISFGSLPYICEGLDDVTVEAGTFPAYKISTSLFHYYFAPDVGNVIKIVAGIEDFISIQGELSSKNYD